jgi:hypothetical protein
MLLALGCYRAFCGRSIFMLRRGSRFLSLAFDAIFLTLCVAHPATAQRGAGGVGGGLAGVGGLSGKSGPASGIDTKDDLRGYHEALALQATTSQIAEFNSMLKNTEAAISGLHTFLDPSSTNKDASGMKAVGVAVTRSIEDARTANSKFLDHLSDRQKADLRETIKKLTKADSDLALRAKLLDSQLSDSKPAPGQLSASAQSLQASLANFRDDQLTLGGQMSIGSGADGNQLAFNIRPARNTVNLENQSVSIITSGTVTQAPSNQSQFALSLVSDIFDLQQNITDVLRAQLNQSDSCGEQIAVQSALFSPSIPAAVVSVQLHYERWRCMGKGMASEMAEGSGTIEVKLTPAIENANTLRLLAQIQHVDADGPLGDSLRSGALGENIRDKIAALVLSTLRQGSDYKTILPAAAQGHVALHDAEFSGTGSGRLSLILNGGILMSVDQVSSLVSELKAGETAAQPATQTQR